MKEMLGHKEEIVTSLIERESTKKLYETTQNILNINYVKTIMSLVGRDLEMKKAALEQPLR